MRLNSFLDCTFYYSNYIINTYLCKPINITDAGMRRTSSLMALLNYVRLHPVLKAALLTSINLTFEEISCRSWRQLRRWVELCFRENMIIVVILISSCWMNAVLLIRRSSYCSEVIIVWNFINTNVRWCSSVLGLHFNMSWLLSWSLGS